VKKVKTKPTIANNEYQKNNWDLEAILENSTIEQLYEL
jgi:hypothetical protein